MKKIGIFFGPKGGHCEKIAYILKRKIGEISELQPVVDCDEKSLDKFNIILFGLSTIGKETWESDQPKKDWAYFFTKLNHANLKNKKVAIFGLGDHLTYASQFVDDMGLLYEKLLEKGAEIFGFTDLSDYEFTDSKAIKNGKFVGLPLDENYESEKTDQRIEKWLVQLKSELGF